MNKTGAIRVALVFCVLLAGMAARAAERADIYAAELVSFYVRNGVSIMPFFRKTEISDKDLVADLGSYLSSFQGANLSPDRQ